MRLMVKKIVISLILVAMLGCGFGCSRGNVRHIAIEGDITYNKAVIWVGNEVLKINVKTYLPDETYYIIETTDGIVYRTPKTATVLISDEGEE